MGGYGGMSRKDPAYQAFEVANTAFGGQFASRINLNLREDKGYTYGVRSQMVSFRDGGVFMITAPVETPATAASVEELIGEMADIRGPRPLSDSGTGRQQEPPDHGLSPGVPDLRRRGRQPGRSAAERSAPG